MSTNADYLYYNDLGVEYRLNCRSDFAAAIGMTPATGLEPALPTSIGPRYAIATTYEGQKRVGIPVPFQTIAALNLFLGVSVSVAGYSWVFGSATGETNAGNPFLSAGPVGPAGPTGATGATGPAGPSYTPYQSNFFATVANQSGSLPHGLGVIPSWISLILQCTTANNGFAVGDQVFVAPYISQFGGVDYGVQVVATTGFLNYRIYNTTTVWPLINPSTGAAFGGANANFSWSLRAGK